MITIEYLNSVKDRLYSAVLSDALDQMGYREQSPGVFFKAYTLNRKLVGRCKNTLWEDIEGNDPDPYAMELQAVDSCMPGDVFIAAAHGSLRSGIWGELLSTAAVNRKCAGAVIHGAVRDVVRMSNMGFNVYATGTRVYDSLHRQRVIAVDIPVEMDGVILSPNDIVFCDEDGMVVIPSAIEEEVFSLALKKVNSENKMQEEINQGMLASEAYQKYGIL